MGTPLWSSWHSLAMRTGLFRGILNRIHLRFILRIVPLFIGISWLLPLDLAMRITHQNGLVKSRLSVSDSSFT